MEVWEGDGMLREVVVEDALSRAVSLFRATALLLGLGGFSPDATSVSGTLWRTGAGAWSCLAPSKLEHLQGLQPAGGDLSKDTYRLAPWDKESDPD